MDSRLHLLARCITKVDGDHHEWKFNELQLRYLYALAFDPTSPDVKLRPLTKDQRRVFDIINFWTEDFFDWYDIHSVEELATHFAARTLDLVDMLEKVHLEVDGYITESHKQWSNTERVKAEAVINTVNEIKN